MHKKVIGIILTMFVIIALVGCSCSYFSLTYDVNTGETVKITLDTSDGYSISASSTFIISKDGKEISKGSFITRNTYDLLYGEIMIKDDITVISTDFNDDYECVFYTKNTEFNYIILLKGGKTGFFLSNKISEESAKEVFNLLTFKIIE